MASCLARILTRRLHTTVRRDALAKFAMPAMSPTMTEGGIASWKKKEGDSFTSGDVLLEIETDKATIDVEAQDDGILAKIVVGDGSKNVQVGSLIAVIAEESDDLAGVADYITQASSETKPSPRSSKSEEKSEAAPPPKSEAQAKPRQSLPPGQRIFASPIAKKLALERGIPLSKIKGTGPEGRIIRGDVEKFQPSLIASSNGSAPSLPEYTDIPISNMRRTIGSRLMESKQNVPHYYVTVDIHMDKVLKLREVFNKALEAEGGKGGKLSVNDFVVKAVACALNDVPEANSSWVGDVIRRFNKADISMAVATPNGLITPIIKDAGSKGLASISTEAKALAKKARDGKLAPHEYQGGTFTVSNLGMFSVSHFTAIINPPQSCILAVGSTTATLVPAPEEERGFKTVHVMKATLSSDHRTVDGAVAARWMAAFKGYLENPLTFML